MPKPGWDAGQGDAAPRIGVWQAQFENETVELEAHNWHQLLAQALRMERERSGRTKRGPLVKLEWLRDAGPQEG